MKWSGQDRMLRFFTKMGRVHKCCVSGCDDVLSKRHRFPKNNPTLFKKWVNIIRPSNWEVLSVDTIYNRHYVCDSHFEDRYKSAAKRGLIIDAVPTLGIPGSSNVNCDVINDTSTSKITTNHLEDSQPGVQAVMVSGIQGIEDNFHDYCTVDPVEVPKVQGSIPSVLHDLINQPSTSEITNNQREICRTEAAESIIVPRIRENSILARLNYTRIRQLNQRERVLYQMLRKCRDQLNQKKQQLKSFKERCTCGSRKS